MKSLLIVVGVLGGGTAAAFALAGAIFLAAPQGRLVPMGNGGFIGRDVMLPPPVPGVAVPDIVVVDEGKDVDGVIIEEVAPGN